LFLSILTLNHVNSRFDWGRTISLKIIGESFFEIERTNQVRERLSQTPSFSVTMQRRTKLFRRLLSSAARVRRITKLSTFALCLGIVLVYKIFPANTIRLEYPEPSVAVVSAARAIFAKDGRQFIYISFINSAYVQYTQSWLCNLALLRGDVLNNLLLIVDSETTKQKLSHFLPDAQVQVYAIKLPGAVSYGYVSYFYLTAVRLHVQNILIQQGISVFVVESDAAWFADDVDEILLEHFKKFDVVSQPNYNGKLYDTHEPQICAGFSGYIAKPHIKRFFNEYVDMYKAELASASLRAKRGYVGDASPGEQVLLSSLTEKSSIAVGWLHFCDFATGIWYTDNNYRSNCKPKVIQNNFISGLDAKIARARAFGHWFLEDGRCRLFMTA
jgi:hypothetical protein